MAIRKSLPISNVGEDAEKREPLYTDGGNANWCSPLKAICRFLKKIKIELPYDPLLGIHPEKKKEKENINSNRYMHPNVHSHLFKSYDCLNAALIPKGKSGTFVSRMVLLAKRLLM